MRAEYVAPFGFTSLVFNFLFARFLVGTSTDIVVYLYISTIKSYTSLGNDSGRPRRDRHSRFRRHKQWPPETDVAHLTYLWRRGGWLGFCMTFALIFLMIFTFSLDAVLSAPSDLSSEPFAICNVRREKLWVWVLCGTSKLFKLSIVRGWTYGLIPPDWHFVLTSEWKIQTIFYSSQRRSEKCS